MSANRPSQALFGDFIACFGPFEVGIVFALAVGVTPTGGEETMSPRNFWNHPLQELARSLVHSFGPHEAGQLTTDEFTEFLGRLVGTTAQGPGLIPQPVSRVVCAESVKRMPPKSS
jgi:hypothetical protein